MFQVDRMDDSANIAFAAFPERLYVLKNGNIVFQVSFRKMLHVIIVTIFIIF